MPGLRITYELTRITYAGARIGVDWTFFVRTGAGLVTFNCKVEPGDDVRVRVLGVRELPEAGRAADSGADSGADAEFDDDDSELDDRPVVLDRELWWASATEHDTAVPEHGAGMFTPVWVPLEPGVEVHRSLAVDVAEASRWTRRGRVAHLRLDVRARVEALADVSAEPPALDATPLVPDASVPKPAQTAGELPLRFAVEVEGVALGGDHGAEHGDASEAEITVHGERVLMVGRDTPPPILGAASDPRAEPLRNFLTHFSGAFAGANTPRLPGPPAGMPVWYEPQAALYELRNRDGEPFWIGRSSSMGVRNDRRIVEAFADAAAPIGEPITDELGGFEARSSLLVELLATVRTAELGPSAKAIAELIAALIVQHPERATVEREVYVRTAIIDEHSGEWTYAFIVDPRPYSGPDELGWLVVWTDAWTE